MSLIVYIIFAIFYGSVILGVLSFLVYTIVKGILLYKIDRKASQKRKNFKIIQGGKKDNEAFFKKR